MQHLYRLSARLWAQAPAAHPHWPDPDQPGAMGEPAQEPAPAAAAAEAPSRGQPLRARPRSRSVPPPAPRSARHEAAAAPLQLGRPRPSLCARTARWLRAGAGLLTCALLYSASRQVSSRDASISSAAPGSPGRMNSNLAETQANLAYEPTHPLTPFKGTTLIEGGALEAEQRTALAPTPGSAPAPAVTAPEADTREATEEMTPRSPVAQPAKRPLAASVGGTTSSKPLAPQTLSETIEKILLESDPRTKLSTLATQLAERHKGTFPLVVVDRMVDAYRASRLWRKPDAMHNFLFAMIDALSKGGMNIEQFEHLLRIWSWRYGELHDRAGKEIAHEKYVHPAWIVMPLTIGLGGASISDRDLRLLLASVTKEPDNIRPGTLKSGQPADVILTDHANRVADAVLELMARITPEAVSGASAEKFSIGAAQVARCVRMFLQQPTGDRRWHPLVLTHLEREVPRTAKGETMPAPQWKHLILQAVQQHLAETAPDLVPARSFGEAIMALFNPEVLQSGQKFDIKFTPH